MIKGNIHGHALYKDFFLCILAGYLGMLHLSLSGRLVLIRSILFGIPVYWFSLARLPSSILNRLLQYIFSFLWGGTTNHHTIHLVDWKTLSRPFELGGWSIKHLGWFSLSLRMKSLWSFMMSNGIWHQALQAKYLKGAPSESWLCHSSFSMQNTSYIWNGFV